MLFQKFIIGIGSLGGIGFIPKAPGTFATLASVPIYLVVAKNLSPELFAAVTLALILVAIPVAGSMERYYKRKDCKETVIDETAGFFTTMLWLPCQPLTLISGFLFFRLFDIVKPIPISLLDKRVPGGLGVVVDDVAAGIMANLATRLVLHILGAHPL